MSELYGFRDSHCAVTPAGRKEMIAKVKGLAPIRGYRNRPRGDVKALAEAVAPFDASLLKAGRSGSEKP